MKKTIVILLSTALGVGLVFGTLWVVKHPAKTKYLINKWCYDEGTYINDYTERVRLEKELDSLNTRYKKLESLFRTLSDEPGDPQSKTSELNREIGELKSENYELRQELDRLKSFKSEPIVKKSKKHEKPSSEKSIPIARNSNAAELQKFLTDLYGNR